MNKIIRILVLAMIAVVLLACSLANRFTPAEEVIAPFTAAPPTLPPPPAQPSPSLPPPTETVAQPVADLDACTLVTTAEVEAILAEPATPPNPANGGCSFTNAKDSLYALSIGAGQDQQAKAILQGQAMLMGFAGGKLDEARMTQLKTLADAMDTKGFFSELVAAAEGVPTIHATLLEGGKSDVGYWAWITAQERRQGAFVAVRGATVVNINLVVSDSQSEEAMLAASTSLADKIFERLPAKFTLAMPTPPTAQPVTNPTPTLAATVEAPAGTPTLVPAGLPAPNLINPADGTTFNNFPRTTTLAWGAVPGASRYVVEIEGCSGSNPAECFPHPMYEKDSRETNELTYTFNFLGAQPGRWRVWALDSQGLSGEKSAWWTFSYTK